MSIEEILKEVPKETTITLKQAQKLRKSLFKGNKGCETCLNKSMCARFGGSLVGCRDFHVALGIQLGYNIALKNTKNKSD